MEEDEEQVEEELAAELESHKATIQELDEALTVEPDNEELAGVREELVEAMRTCEANLLKVKQMRLLAMVGGLPGVREAAPDSSQSQSQSQQGPGGAELDDREEDDYDVDDDDPDEDDDDDDDDDSDAEDEDRAMGGLGLGSGLKFSFPAYSLGAAAERAEGGGAGTDTVLFAEWEVHTSGAASRMMARMGYVKGTGLGRTGQGISEALIVDYRPPQKGLGCQEREEGEGGVRKKAKKRKRGGERSRAKKAAAAAREQRAAGGLPEEQYAHGGMFGAINRASAGAGIVEEGVAGGAQRSRVFDVRKPKAPPATDRGSLLSRSDETSKLRTQVQRLEEMMKRNRNDRATYAALAQKMDAAKRQLAASEGQHARQQAAVKQKEDMKKWMKF